MGDISFTIKGISPLLAELDAVKNRIADATQRATTQTGQQLRTLAILHMHGSHPPGFHHVGGDAPNVVSGWLAESIIDPPAVAVGTGRYTTRVAPTAIYSRVIEFGAHITPTDRKYLSWFDAQYGVRRFRKEVNIPPHSFFRPARDEMPPKMRQIYVRRLTEALEV